MIPPIIIPAILTIFIINISPSLDGVVLPITALAVSLLFIIIIYLIFSIRLFNLAKKDNSNNELLAFIPFIHFYLIGLLIKEKTDPRALAIMLSMATIFTSLIPVLHLDLWFVLIINMFTSTYFYQLKYLYEKYGTTNPKALAIWSVIFPVAIPFFIPRIDARRNFTNY
jgi:hypothetical protein